MPIIRNIPLRHELKYFITPAEMNVLRGVLTPVMQLDPNGNENNEYHIRSLYFDTINDSALEEKKHNKGLTLVQTAELMESLGCAAAYNLDGGQSALMWYRDGILSTPYHGGRSVGDIIILCEEPGIAPARQETVQEAPAEETDVAEATVQPTATPAPAEEEWNWEDYEVLE